MSNTQSDSPTHENEITSEREMENLTGRVKWFNRKNGYGFITVISEDEDEQRDVFVHYDNINTSQEQFRYLVEGEYVNFDIGASSQADHEVEAHNIRGIEGHKLMCETRREQMENRPPRRVRQPRQQTDQHQTRQHQHQHQSRGGGHHQRRYVPKGRVVEVDNTEWMMVPLGTTGGNRGRGRGRGGGRGGGRGRGGVYQQ